MIGGAFLPAVSSASDSQYIVYNNDTGQYASLLDSDVSLRFEYAPTEGINDFYVNNIKVDLLTGQDGLIVTDFMFLKTGVVNNPSNYVCYYNEGVANIVRNIMSLNMEVVDNVATITFVSSAGNSTTFNSAVSWGFYATTTGDYRSIITSGEFYYTDFDNVYGANTVDTTSGFFSYHGDEVLYNGAPLTMNYNKDRATGSINVYKDSVGPNGTLSFVIDNGGTDYTVKPYVAIIPAKVIGDKTGYSDTISNMFNILPIVAIAGLIMSGIYVFISRK